MPIKITISLLAAALAMGGCGSKSKSSSASNSKGSSASKTTPTPTPTTQKIPGPKIGVAITRPKDGATVGSTVAVRVTLANFVLDRKDFGKAPAPGKGHLQFSLDGGKFDFPQYSGPNGKMAKKLGVAGTYSPSVTPTIVYRHLPPGPHMLVVKLANNDNSDAGAQAKASFTVKSSKAATNPKFKAGQLCSPAKKPQYRAVGLTCKKSKGNKYRLTK